MTKKDGIVEKTPCPVCNNKINKLKHEHVDGKETGIFICARNHRFKISGAYIECIAIPSSEDQNLKDEKFEFTGKEWKIVPPTLYLERVDGLYITIKKWMADLSPKATFTLESESINEAPYGQYSANTFLIKRAGKKDVRLVPRGQRIIGAVGRIDMKSDLGTETLVYTSEGGPHIRVNILTENGHFLEKGTPRPVAKGVHEGWVHVHDRQLGILPKLDKELFSRLLEVLS